MSQTILPLSAGGSGAPRIIVGNANAHVVEALSEPARWPFRTAVLAGPPRSGKSLLGRWFSETGAGDVLDGADSLPEDEVFHHWNRAQENGRPLLIISNRAPGSWQITLPDLASRLGAAMHLQIITPDDTMMAELIELHAEMRGLLLGPAAADFLVPRGERSHLNAERVVAAIDRLSLERKTAATSAIWREALNEVNGIAGNAI